MAYENAKQASATPKQPEGVGLLDTLGNISERLQRVATRLDNLSERLNGPRPRDVADKRGETQPGAFAHRFAQYNTFMGVSLDECDRSLAALEAFI